MKVCFGGSNLDFVVVSETEVKRKKQVGRLEQSLWVWDYLNHTTR